MLITTMHLRNYIFNENSSGFFFFYMAIVPELKDFGIFFRMLRVFIHKSMRYNLRFISGFNVGILRVESFFPLNVGLVFLAIIAYINLLYFHNWIYQCICQC